MWNVVKRAAISVSADLEELWFLGDLLGIFWISEVFVFFFLFFLDSLATVVLGTPALLFGLVVLGVLEGMRYCGGLMGFRRRRPLI